MITQSELQDILNYDIETGIFTWKIKPCKNIAVNTVAGGINNRNYVVIKIKNKTYLAHRLAWLYVYGEIPDFIDHINGNKSDNKIKNLRECSQQENCFNRKLAINNKCGVKGICFYNKTKKWKAQLNIDGKRKHLGYFDNIEDAKEVLNNARIKHHKEFARNE